MECCNLFYGMLVGFMGGVLGWDYRLHGGIYGVPGCREGNDGVLKEFIVCWYGLCKYKLCGAGRGS